jgi:hypothetical protein
VSAVADQERFADKVAKLLRKAEDPGASPAEAEAFLAKAQALMVEYAITEELLARARGDVERTREEVVESSITYTGIYHQALFDVGSAVAKANDCRVLIRRGGKSTTLIIIGFESDVARVKMLDASAQIQATGGLVKWWKQQDSSWMSGMQKYKARREFLFGFASGLASKLQEARAQGHDAAAEAQVKREHVAKTDAAEGVALVVRDKKAHVNDWVDQTYGRLRYSSRRYSSGGYEARNSGHAAGRRADLGGKAVAGGGKQLGR